MKEESLLDIIFNEVLSEAEKTLEENAISSIPVPIVDIANSYGLEVDEGNMEGNMGGYHGEFYYDTKKIIVNENTRIPIKRFVIAKLLGFYLIKRRALIKNPPRKMYAVSQMPILSDGKILSEKKIDYFAANLLIPFKFLKIFTEKYKEHDFLPSDFLSDKFIVPPTVMHFQLKNFKEL